MKTTMYCHVHGAVETETTESVEHYPTCEHALSFTPEETARYATCLLCDGPLVPGVNSAFCCETCEGIWAHEYAEEYPEVK